MEEALIDNVRIHEVLFNTYCPQYRNQQVRNEAWEEIGEQMNLTASRCKELWAKLRNCYLNAIRRRRSKKTGHELRKCGLWKYEDQMSFLLPYVEIRTPSMLEDVRELENVEGLSNVVEEYREDFKEYDEDDSLLDDRTSRAYTLKKSKPTIDLAKEIVDTLKVNSNENQAEQKDEVDLFYLSMAKTVKRLPKMDQAKIRMELCRMVSMAEISQMSSSATTQIQQPESTPATHYASRQPSPTVSPAPSQENTVYKTAAKRRDEYEQLGEYIAQKVRKFNNNIANKGDTSVNQSECIIAIEDNQDSQSFIKQEDYSSSLP